MKRTLSILFAGLFVVVGCGNVWAQATAQIAGTVKDQTGAVLPGVEVTVTQTDTGTTRTAVTNETGSYLLPNLPIGPYKLEAALPGFRTYAQTGIVLQVNASPVINPVLEVGQVTEQVQVEANAALVETRSAGVGAVVENTRILELPLNGRNVIDLVTIQGAATPAPTLSGAGGRDPFAKGNYSVAGGMHTGVSYTLDGAYHMNPYTNGYMSLPFPDALQEFKVETGATGAQTGMKSSGSVSLVTKSGTNQFHGDAFEFVRNGKFNARNTFALSRDTIKRNQFGGVLGGPIKTNRLFFFGGYQGTIVRQDPSDLLAFVPTAAMKAGDFTTFASAACNNGRAMTLRAPFVNNRVDPSLFSPAAVKITSKLPTALDECGKTLYGMPKLEDDHTFVSRIDYQRSDKHSIFGRYLYDDITVPPPFDVTHNLVTSTGIATGNRGRAQGLTLGDTYLISPNVVNAFHITGNRIFSIKSSPDFSKIGAGTDDVGIKAYTYLPHYPGYNITGGFSTGYNGAGKLTSAILSLSDDLSVLHGNHQMAYGAQYSYWQVNSYSDSNAKLAFSFNGQTYGLGMADFLLGRASQLSAGTFSEQFKNGKYIGIYGADTWKLNQRWTLTYGMRWEPYFPLRNRDGSAINFDENALRQGTRSQRLINAPPGLTFTGDPGFKGETGQKTRILNFSPRLGFAFDPRGTGRTSIRASVGMFYDFPSTLFLAGLNTGAPFSPRVIVTDINLDNPWANYPNGDPHPMLSGRSLPKNAPWGQYSSIIDLDYDTPNVRVFQRSLSVQQQFGTDWLVSVSYLGSNTSHLWSLQQTNPAVFLGLGPCTLGGVQYTTCSTTANQNERRRLRLAYPTPGVGDLYGNVARVDSGGTANYNGLLLSVQRQAVRGVTVSGNYTWSHCISDPWIENINSGIGGTGWNDSNNRRFDRGNCSITGTDRRHVFNLSAVARTPQFTNSTARLIASGWQFSPLFKILSGDYFSVVTNQDRALTASNSGVDQLATGQRVNQVLGNPYGDKTANNYLNPAAFAIPALGTFGNMAANSIRGPRTWEFNAALSRTFQIKEAQKIEFRAEAFNLTNSVRLGDPDTVLNSNTFGQIKTALDPRILQFALKYVF
jgi:Carboxypeptidase regulatory-like domain